MTFVAIPGGADSSPNTSQTQSTASPAVRQITPTIVPIVPSEAHPPVRVSRRSAVFGSLLIDPGMERLMAAHTDGGRFAVLNLSTDAVRHLHTGPVCGIAVDVPDNKIFAAGNSQKVVVLDRRSLARIDEIDLGGHAEALALDTEDYRLFVDHCNIPDLWMLDAKTHQLIGTIRLDGAPSSIVFDPADNAMLQAVDAPDRLERIDPAAAVVSASWPTAPASAPAGLAVDPADFMAFVVGSHGTLVAMDTRTGAILGSAPIAEGAGSAAFDPASRQVFCASGGDGVVSVVHVTPAGQCRFVGQIATHAGASTLAIDDTASSVDVWVCYPAASGSYIQCFSVAR